MGNTLRLYLFSIFCYFVSLVTASAQTCQAFITAAGNTTLCAGDSVLLTANAGQTYHWSNGKTGRSIYAATAGNYSVTVTDASGCAATSSPVPVAVLTKPDAALQDTIDNFMNCTYSLGAANFRLRVENISKTKATNTQYSIDWGDGSSNVYGSNFTDASHTYTLPGSFNLTFTATNAAGCSASETYLVFNGSNPSFGVASQGNTNDCAPATFTFDIINTQGNTPSTVYTFQFDDGTPALHYTHANLPKTITHTFTKSAMGKPGNAFTLTAYATNPCGTTPATVGGIRISETPKADFLMNPDSIACVNSPVTLSDYSNGGFNANASGTAATGFTREWIIKPATGWNFTNGTNNTSPQPILNFTQTGTYQIHLIVTPRGAGAKCEADSISKTIIIKEQPYAGFTVQAPTSLCAPVPFTLQNTRFNPEFTYTWEILPKQGWGFSASSDSVSLNPELTFTQAGTYTVKLTARNYCGQIATVDSVITIAGVPVVSLPPAQEYCISQTVAFSAQNPAHQPTFKSASPINIFKWSVAGNSGFQFVNGTTPASQFPEIKFTSPGVYQVIFQAANACGFSAPDTQRVTIHPAPQLAVQASVAALCQGQGSAILTASGADAYAWFPATGLNKTTGNVVSANPAVTTTYNLIGTNTLTGCADTIQYTVVVNPPMPLTVSASATSICQSQQTTTLSASGGHAYTWSPAIGLNTTSGASVIASPAVSTTYTVTAIDTVAGCSATKTIRIEVLPQPIVNIGIDTVICVSPQGLQLQGFPKGGTWSGQNVSSSGFFVGSSSGTYQVTYNYTNTGGCFASATKKITVVIMPVVYAGNDTTFCAQNASVLLKGLPAGGSWSGSNLVTSAGAFTANKPGTYTLTYTYGNGSCQVSDVKAITVNALPSTPIVQNQTICPGTTVTLTAQSTNAVRYEWFDALSGGNLVHTGQNFTTPALLQSKTYFVVAYNAEGCQSTSRTAVQVTVNPAVPAAITSNVTVCGPGSQATLTASGATGTYAWYDAPQNGNLLFTGSVFQTNALQVTTDFYVQAISAEGCASFSRSKATVFVLPALTNNTLSGNQTICANEIPAALFGSMPFGGNGTYTFSWEFSTDSVNFHTVSGSVNTANFLPGALNQTTWFRRKVASGVCSDLSQPVKVTVIPRPVAPVLTTQTVCAGASATLTAPANGLQYQWFSSATGGQPVFSGNVFVTPALQHTTEYFLETLNAQGCRSAVRSKVVVTVLPVIANNYISQNQTICANEIPAALTGSNPTGGNNSFAYTWESSLNGITFTPAAGTNNAVGYAPAALQQTTWFRRVITSGPCQLHTSASVKITVIPVIAANQITSQPQIICASNTPQLLQASQPTGGTGTFTYLWHISTVSATTGFVPAPNVNQNATYQSPALQQTTWFRRVVNSGNCSNTSVAIKIEVNPPLAANIISASQTVYSGSTPALIHGSLPTGGNGNYTYYWEISVTGATSGFNSLTTTSQHFQPGAITQTTWLRRTVRSGDCDLVSNVVQLTVVPAISNNVIQQNQTICQNNAPALLTGTAPIGGTGNFTYLWEMSTSGTNAGFTTATGNSNQATYQPGVLNQTSWYKRTVISGAYTLESNVIQITVNPNIANNTISMAQTICAGSTPAKLRGSVPTGGSGNYTYVWEMSTSVAANSFISASGINHGADYQPNILQQTTWFRRKVSAGYCADLISEPVEIKVNQVPSPPAIASQDICSGTSALLVLPAKNTASQTHYEWYESAVGGQLIGKGVSFTTPALTKSKTYYVQAVENGCASARVAVEVNVREATADAGEDKDLISGRSVTLAGKGGVSYKWFPETGLSNPNIVNPVASPTKTTTYTLEVVSEAGCVSTDEVTLTVLPKIQIVNTFSPNNDGINDTWEIKGLEEYRNCRIEIFNRWGAKVYESVGYPQPWNGVSSSGEVLPIATYYYIIYLNKTEAPLSGSINIIR